MSCAYEELVNAYGEILSELPLHWFDHSRAHEPEFAKLSGLFLPGTSPAYEQSRQRIMVVGRETRTWNVISEHAPFQSLDEYIQRAMAIQQENLARYLIAPPSKGASFFNFLRALASMYGPYSIAWANLFGFAWNGKSPVSWSNFPKLLDISEQLLKAQIRILNPDIIIFANGASSANIRQKYFPYKGEKSVCSRFADYSDQGIANRQLWRFYLNGTIQCYRIQHPSSFRSASRAAREFLLTQVLSDSSKKLVSIEKT